MVQLEGLDGLESRLIEVVVIEAEGHSVAGEVLAVLVQTVFLKELAHGLVHEGHVLVGGNTVFAGNLNRDEAGQEAAVLHLLHQGEKRSAQGFRGGSRHLESEREGKALPY